MQNSGIDNGRFSPQTHNLPHLYNFHKYMIRSMEDEFETIVGIR